MAGRKIFVAIVLVAVMSFYCAIKCVTRGGANYVVSHGGIVHWNNGAACVNWVNAGVTDSDLACLVEIRCLTILHIEENQRISDLGLKEIAKNAKELSILNVEGTSVTQEGILQFIDSFPSCDIWWQGRYWSTAIIR